MATDILAIERNLLAFYDFHGKDVIHVGAGGGQLIGYARLPKRVVAVDSDAGAMARLRSRIREAGLGDKIETREEDFLAVRCSSDVVFFEFCLHEMTDPGGAIDHARTLAPYVLVIDHLPDSRWSWYAGEESKLAASWREIEARPIKRRKSFEAAQIFERYEDLRCRIGDCGEECLRRIAPLASEGRIEIPMPYGIVLL